MASPVLATFSLLLAFVCGCALATRSLEQSAQDNNAQRASVIIVGAGMAGIMAAKTLSDNSVRNFVILEGSETIGGRMREATFLGLNLEMGANWVEGVNATTTNPIWKLAKRHKLNTYYSNFDNISHNIYTQSGIVKPIVSEPLFKQNEDEEEFVEDLGLEKSSANEPDVSILTAQRLYGRVPSKPVEMALNYYAYDYEFAEPTRVTSLKNTQPNPTFYNFGESNFLVTDQRGYSHLVQALAEEFLYSKNGRITDSRLKLNSVVNNIRYSPQGVTVKTEDGKVYNADKVIVTVSLGVLQSKLIEFQPSLPEWKLEALEEFDMCVYTKIFLKFPYRFWPKGPLTEFFIYADERVGYYPIWQHLENEFPGENLLFVTVTDIESRRIEQQPVEETLAEIMGVLRNMFGSSVPEPLGILFPKWWSSRLFAGSFSNWPIGVEDYEFERLQAHINSLYFAGEHTHEHYNGYVHGAYYSGIDAAKDVLKCLKSGKGCKTKIPQPPANRVGSGLRRSMSEAEAHEERAALRREWKQKSKEILAKATINDLEIEKMV